MCQNPKSRMQSLSKNHRCRFYKLLKSFKKIPEYDSVSLPIPPMLGDGKQVDLLKLFLIVRENGGYEAVSMNKLWGFVAEECGHTIKLGASVKLVYIKYLCALGLWVERSVEDQSPLFGVAGSESLMRVIDEFKEFLSLVPNSKELGCKLNLMATKFDFGQSETWAVELDHHKSKQNGVYVTDHLTKLNNAVGCKTMDSFANGDKTHRGVDKNLIVDLKVSMGKNRDEGKICSNANYSTGVIEVNSDLVKLRSGIKRKRESMSRMLTWVTGVARNPCDPVVVTLPEPSMWRSYGNEELWKRALLVREKLFLKDMQKMNPSTYSDDHVGLCKLSKRSKCTKRPRQGKVSYSMVLFSQSPCSVNQTQASPLIGCVGNGKSYGTPGIDIPTDVAVPRGPRFQAEAPEWSGVIVESDPKWTGTRIWPLENEENELNIENKEIGQGRQDSCGCEEPNSIECVRLHVAERKLKLKNELGIVFEHWQLDKTGEVVSLSWTNKDKKKIQIIVNSYKNYWNEMVKSFSTKKTKDLVNYLFNVVLLQKRAHQNRFAPEKVYTDSDDDNETNEASGKCRTTIIRTLYSSKKQ